MKYAVVCWLWEGWRGTLYQPDHVERLHGMLTQHLNLPFDFFCVTDMRQELFDTSQTVPLPKIPWMPHRRGAPSCWYKLWMFGPEAAEVFKDYDRIISVDLDVLIRADITDLFDGRVLKVLQGYSSPYNTSLVQLRPGAFPWIWDELNEVDAVRTIKQRVDGRRYSGSDQAYLSHKLPGYFTWSEEDGIYQYSITPKLPDDCRLAFFAGGVKPWESRYASEYWGYG